MYVLHENRGTQYTKSRARTGYVLLPGFVIYVYLMEVVQKEEFDPHEKTLRILT